MPLLRFTGKSRALIAIVVLALIGGAGSFFVFAASPNPVTSHSLINFELNVPLASANITGSDIDAGTAIGTYIKAVYEFLVRAAAILAAMMFTYGGLLWLTAAGEKGRIGEAQKVMTNALVGLVLALGSYTILYTINPKLKSLDNVNPQLIAAKPMYLPVGNKNGACCYVANPGTSATISIGAPSEQHAFETIDQKTCEQEITKKLQAKEVDLGQRPQLAFCRYAGKDTSGMLPDVRRRFAEQMCWSDDPSIIAPSKDCPDRIDLSKLGEGYCSAAAPACPREYSCNIATGVCDKIPTGGPGWHTASADGFINNESGEDIGGEDDGECPVASAHNTLNRSLALFRSLLVPEAHAVETVVNETCPIPGLPLLKQRAYTEAYGECGTIATSGCGPTSAAMVISKLKGSTVSPVDVGKVFADAGFRGCKPNCTNANTDCSGTLPGAFTSEESIGKFNLKGKSIPKGEILEHLRRGEPIIVGVGNSIFTDNGHIIVLTGTDEATGNITINDPWGKQAGDHGARCYKLNGTKYCGAVPAGYVLDKVHSAFWIYKEDMIPNAQ